MPRLSNSRIAAALLGIRFAKRQVSTIRSSSCVSMIWSRSPLLSSPIFLSREYSLLERKNPKISSLLFILINLIFGV